MYGLTLQQTVIVLAIFVLFCFFFVLSPVECVTFPAAHFFILEQCSITSQCEFFRKIKKKKSTRAYSSFFRFDLIRTNLSFQNILHYFLWLLSEGSFFTYSKQLLNFSMWKVNHLTQNATTKRNFPYEKKIETRNKLLLLLRQWVIYWKKKNSENDKFGNLEALLSCIMGHYQERRLRQIKRHSKETFAQWWLFYDNCFLLVYYIYYWQITLQVDWRARRRIKSRHWKIYCIGFTFPLKLCVWKFCVVVVDYVKEFY